MKRINACFKHLIYKFQKREGSALSGPFSFLIIKVRMEGVEPTRLAALDPKSSASANFATSAQGRKNRGFVKNSACFYALKSDRKNTALFQLIFLQ